MLPASRENFELSLIVEDFGTELPVEAFVMCTFDVLFDALKADPYAVGIEHVVVNGVHTVAHGELTNARGGQVIRHGLN